MKCHRCGRSLRNPIRWAGMVFGSTCAKAVGAAAVVAQEAKASRARRRVVVLSRVQDADPQQLSLLEVV